MKKIETTYYCDVCGRERPVKEVILPRRIDSTGKFKILVRYMKTDICDDCALHIAEVLPVLRAEIDDGYMD